MASPMKSKLAKRLIPLGVVTVGLLSPLAFASPAQAAYFPLGDCTRHVYYWQGKTATYHHTDGNTRYYLIRNGNGSLPNPQNWYDQANWASCYN
jgi:hypothetical protein